MSENVAVVVPVESDVSTLCEQARAKIVEAEHCLVDAAYASAQGGNYERDKVLTALAEALRGLMCSLISLPRLRG
jgi:hypothetical protein